MFSLEKQILASMTSWAQQPLPSPGTTTEAKARKRNKAAAASITPVPFGQNWGNFGQQDVCTVQSDTTVFCPGEIYVGLSDDARRRIRSRQGFPRSHSCYLKEEMGRVHSLLHPTILFFFFSSSFGNVTEQMEMDRVMISSSSFSLLTPAKDDRTER